MTNQQPVFFHTSLLWQWNLCGWVRSSLIHVHTKFEWNRTISKFLPISTVFKKPSTRTKLITSSVSHQHTPSHQKSAQYLYQWQRKVWKTIDLKISAHFQSICNCCDLDYNDSKSIRMLPYLLCNHIAKFHSNQIPGTNFCYTLKLNIYFFSFQLFEMGCVQFCLHHQRQY